MKTTSPKSYASCTYDSPVGRLTLAAGDDGLKGLWIEGQKYFAGTLDAPLKETPEDVHENGHNDTANAANKHLEQACGWLDRYFGGEHPSPEELTLAPIGSEFRQTIWQLLCEIPFGEVRTYGDLSRDAATRLGKQRMSAQAVGGAVGHNPISIIVPCHRVVGADGSLTGYAGGIKKKLALLEHEGVDTSGFFIPAKSTAP